MNLDVRTIPITDLLDLWPVLTEEEKQIVLERMSKFIEENPQKE
jgi:hypothetical protein